MNRDYIEEMIRKQYCLRNCDSIEITTLHFSKYKKEYLIKDIVNDGSNTTVRKTMLTFQIYPIKLCKK